VDTKGVNFFGSFNTTDGIGRGASLNLKCFKLSKIDCDEYVLSRPFAPQSGGDTVIDSKLLKNLKYRVNFFHFSARWVKHYFSKLEHLELRKFYNIGYWVCETPNISNEWAKKLNFFDEIWTASTFCQESLAKSSKIPIIKIPHPIEKRPLSLRVKNRKQGRYKEPFTFLNIFNVYSDAERKNPLFTIRAFLNAYEGNLNVRLIIKVSNLEFDPILAEKLTIVSKRFKNIEIIDSFIEDSAIQALYDEADVYVSLHRAEGFGLTISDAISRGIPVITTGYSGNMDFCRFNQTRLVDYSLRTVGHDRLRYLNYDIWAEPSMTDAVKAFQEVRDYYSLWATNVLAAREEVSKSFSMEKISHLISNRMHFINNNFNYSDGITKEPFGKAVGIENTYNF